MQTHRNAKLGLSGRFALVQTREAGLSLREVARRFSVSPATVSRWSCRWRAASDEERATLACLFDRSSRPRRMPRLLPVAEQRRICAARRRTGWGPRLLTVATGARTRRSRRCSAQRARTRRAPRASRSVATSGPAPAICFMLTDALCPLRASRARRHRRPHRSAAERKARWATTTRTRSSTTTRGSPTPSCCSTAVRPPSPPSPSGRCASSPRTGSRPGG